MYYIDNPKFRGLVIRKNSKDLDDWIDRAQWMFKSTGAKFTGKPVTIEFPSGAKIRTGHLNDGDAYQQYRGHEYQRMVIEEVTQIANKADYLKLRSACRSTIDIPPRVFLTTNPDGPGFWWVKEYFNIPDWPTGNVYTEEKIEDQLITRIFIPSKLSDNPALNEKDPFYRANLAQNDEGLKKAWLDGYWGEPIIQGVIYENEIKNLRAEGRITTVNWDPKHPVYTYWDIGRDSTPIWFAQLIGNTWNFIDFYQVSNSNFAHIASVLRSKPYWYGEHYGPHDLAKTDMAGENIWSLAEKQGILFTVIPKGSREDGIQAVKAKLPRAYFDAVKCLDGLKALSAYRREYDEEKMVFKDIPVHDWASHPSDAIRGWAVQQDPILPGAMPQNFNLYQTSYN